MKEFLKNVALVGIFFVVLFCVFCWKDMLISFHKPVDINVDYPDDYNDVKAVNTEFDMVLDLFVSEETVTKKNGAITNTRYDYYYIVPVYVESEEAPYFVGVKVSSEDKKTYDKVCDATWKYVYGETDTLETIEFEGGFKKMEDECYEHFVDWFEEAEWFENDKDMEKYVLPLILESFNLARTKKMTFIMAGILAGCILVMVLCCRKSEKEKAGIRYRLIVKINGVDYLFKKLKKVNKYVEKGDKAKAVEELMKITGISETDANAAIMDWDNLVTIK